MIFTNLMRLIDKNKYEVIVASMLLLPFFNLMFTMNTIIFTTTMSYKNSVPHAGKTDDETLEEVAQMARRVAQDNNKESIARAKKMLKELKQKKIKVPIDVFPHQIQDFILTYYNFYKFPIDYYFGSVLSVAGIAIGNKYSSKYDDWEGVGMLWMILVGGSSIGKSEVMKRCEKPLVKIQERLIQQHQNKLKKQHDPTNPPEVKIIKTSKSTNERLIQLMQQNPSGILLSRHEIMGWLKSMNQYTKGGDDKQQVMEWFDNTTWSDNTKGSGFIYLRKPFISVLGGTQPKIVKDLGAKGNADSGFLQRCLFAVPTDLTIPAPVEGKPDFSAYERYEAIITKLYELTDNFIKVNDKPDCDKYQPRSIPINLSQEARSRFLKFRHESRDKRNATDDEKLKSLLGKIQVYVLRFAIILELLEVVCSDTDLDNLHTDAINRKHTISLQTIEKAIKVSKYFEETGRVIIGKLEDPIQDLSPPQQAWYRTLPEHDPFKAETAINLATGMKVRGLSKRTVNDLLKNIQLFKKVGRGFYERLK